MASNRPPLIAIGGNTVHQVQIRDKIAIGEGARAGKNAVAIGHGVEAPDGRFVVLNQDLTDVNSRLEALEKTVAAQQKIIEALWYHPGMPGAEGAEASFTIYSLANDK